MAKPKKNAPQLADCLRHFAWKMCDNPDLYTVEEGKMMDRALRSCPEITDIDVVWIRWGYIGEPLWRTTDELSYNGRTGRYFYP